jgi:hypothetical protein
MPRVPGESPCHCRRGYQCPHCERAERQEAKREAEEAKAREMVEKYRGGDDDDA